MAPFGATCHQSAGSCWLLAESTQSAASPMSIPSSHTSSYELSIYLHRCYRSEVLSISATAARPEPTPPTLGVQRTQRCQQASVLLVVGGLQGGPGPP